jgi:hypothetical protein
MLLAPPPPLLLLLLPQVADSYGHYEKPDWLKAAPHSSLNQP